MTAGKKRAVYEAGVRFRATLAWLASGLALSAILPPTQLSAQTPDLTRQAAFSVDQAEAGAVVYEASCAGCHLPNLAGSF